MKESQEASLPETWMERIESRRTFLMRLGWGGIFVFFLGNLIASLRFFYPRVLFEPSARIKVGKPSAYPLDAVNTRYKDRYRIWIVRRRDGQFLCLSAKCTHLGCTPNWLDSQKKFRCPCHGSGFHKNGENFEGPAPRPLDRFKISLAEDGTLVVDRGVIFKGVAGMDSDELYPQSLLSV